MKSEGKEWKLEGLIYCNIVYGVDLVKGRTPVRQNQEKLQAEILRYSFEHLILDRYWFDNTGGRCDWLRVGATSSRDDPSAGHRRWHHDFHARLVGDQQRLGTLGEGEFCPSTSGACFAFTVAQFWAEADLQCATVREAKGRGGNCLGRNFYYCGGGTKLEARGGWPLRPLFILDLVKFPWTIPKMWCWELITKCSNEIRVEIVSWGRGLCGGCRA